MEKKLDEMIADLRLNGWGSEITESMEKLFRSIAQHIDGAEQQAPAPAEQSASDLTQPQPAAFSHDVAPLAGSTTIAGTVQTGDPAF